MAPKVSVVMSVYNGERYLREAVESILGQTFTEFEFIIVNDGSTDGTREILTAYNDPRIRLVRNEENIGLTRSLNKGLALGRGEYIARMDADDVSLPHRLEVQVRYLDQYPGVGLVACDLQFIDDEGHTLGRSYRSCGNSLVRWYLLFYNYIAAHSHVVFRRDLVANLGGYDETFEYAQDYELWSRLTEISEAVVLPDVLGKWRRHKRQVSVTRAARQRQCARCVAIGNLSRLMGTGWAADDACLELIGFWDSSFCHFQNPLRLQSNLWRSQLTFLKDKVLPNARASVALALRRATVRQLWNLGLSLVRRRDYPKGMISVLMAMCWALEAARTWATRLFGLALAPR